MTTTITLTSSAFAPGASIPVKFTCDGDDVSPPLSWRGVPNETRTLALIGDDPDAPGGTWVHWVLYDVPADVTEIAEAAPADAVLPGYGARQGKNDFGRPGYGGPCPPPGKAHRYFFKLYALDSKSGLEPGATKATLEQAMTGHVLAQGVLMGTYQRK